MKTSLYNNFVASCLVGGCLFLNSQCSFGSPNAPLVWQQNVPFGPLEGQNKHTGWIRDQNNNFVDDALEAMPPTNRTTMIIELNTCPSQTAITEFLSSFGTIRRVGTLVPYVVLDNVRAGDAVNIATNPMVAGVEANGNNILFDDTSGRAVRARASVTYSPETFGDKTASDGSGINVAIVDTGVDDLTHPAFAGKFVAGYDATTDTPGNPPSIDPDFPTIVMGADGICHTTAAGDDIQGYPFQDAPCNTILPVPVGNGFPDPFCDLCGVCVTPNPAIQPGADGTIHSTPSGDDTMEMNLYDGSTPYIAVGANGICDTTADPRDVQVLPVGKGTPWTRACISPGPNGVIDSTPVSPDFLQPGTWHGTHTAGIVMGLGVGSGCRPADDGSVPNDCAGMAPGAGLVNVRVVDSSGNVPDATLLDALDWVWMNGQARVVNMSLGNYIMSDGTESVPQMMDALVLNGIAVVVSAGNSGAHTIGSFAASDLAITVAASDDKGTVDRNDDVVASFSTFGPRSDFTGVNVLPGQLKPDIAAPGVNILSAQGGGSSDYHSLSGTSMAAPCVAGAAALLLSYNPNIPPGCLKDLLKKSAYATPQQTGVLGGPSYPLVDSTYNVHWGYGLLDVYEAYYNLQFPVADITFPSCLPGAAGDNCGGNCNLAGGVASWDNEADIALQDNNPHAGVLDPITISVQNRSASDAQDVQVCVGVLEFNAGNQLAGAYNVGCANVNVAAGATVPVPFNWVPVTGYEHQCIVATINYGFDTDFCNNRTQRNVDNIATHSTETATFKVVNPFNEPATIVLTTQPTNGLFIATLSPSNSFTLQPGECPVVAQMSFTPLPGTPIGATAKFTVAATAYTPSQSNGVALPGVAFNLTEVAGGLQAAYSVGQHSQQGPIKLPLNLAGAPTSDPRMVVSNLLVDFDVPVTPSNGVLTASQVIITASPTNSVPAYTVNFTGGGNSGQELNIVFSQPLMDQQRYHVSFANFTDADGGALLGQLTFDFRVLQGDVNNSGAVTATDISFVRGRLGEVAAYGDSSRADVNMSGAVTATDISFVRSRIGHSAP